MSLLTEFLIQYIARYITDWPFSYEAGYCLIDYTSIRSSVRIMGTLYALPTTGYNLQGFVADVRDYNGRC